MSKSGASTKTSRPRGRVFATIPSLSSAQTTVHCRRGPALNQKRTSRRAEACAMRGQKKCGLSLVSLQSERNLRRSDVFSAWRSSSPRAQRLRALFARSQRVTSNRSSPSIQGKTKKGGTHLRNCRNVCEEKKGATSLCGERIEKNVKNFSSSSSPTSFSFPPQDQLFFQSNANPI